ncbi:MAG: ABC transporter substrate-binding protein [Proteobacteria bacterium]|nr:MAG: ABC transporter substrate-binding protein [Pseudomonadota bacterium]
MNRREFIGLLGGASIWPFGAHAQQPAMPVVGYLDIYAPEPTGIFLAAFRKGLSEVGYVEGRNVAIEYRYANSNNDRLPELASDLVRRGVAVIVAPFGTAAVRAAKRATTTIPIVFVTSADPVQDGLVDSFNRPGGNVTGLSTMSIELGGKRLGLLHELIPRPLRMVALINPNSAIAESLIRDAQAGASTIGWQVDVVYAGTNRDIDAAFASLEQKRAGAIFVSADQFLTSRRVQIATLATHYRVPAIYSYRAFAEVGGLMSYGPNLPDQYRQLGVYAGRILKGEKPAEMSVVQPTKFELVINLTTARTLGLDVPPTLLAIADEVIE